MREEELDFDCEHCDESFIIYYSEKLKQPPRHCPHCGVERNDPVIEVYSDSMVGPEEEEEENGY